MRSASVPLDAAGALPVEDELALVDREGVLVGKAMEGLSKGLAVEVEHRPARLAEEGVILLPLRRGAASGIPLRGSNHGAHQG